MIRRPPRSTQVLSSAASDVYKRQFTNRTLGKVRISLTSAQTANIADGKYFYELMLTDPNGVVERVIEGVVIVKHPVTYPSDPPLTPFVPQVP